MTTVEDPIVKTAEWLTPVNQGQLSVFMLLDRSGSMTGRWKETIGALNAYVEELNKVAGNGSDAEITIAMFDKPVDIIAYDVIRNAVKARDFQPVTSDESSPRGYTPLYDACAKIVAQAETRNSPKTVIVILTDGHENSSIESTKKSIKDKFDELKAKAWQVIFMGVDFDAFDEADKVGVNYSNTLNTEARHVGSSLRASAHRTMEYAKASNWDEAFQAMEYDSDDRDVAIGKITMEEWTKRHSAKQAAKPGLGSGGKG